MCHYPQSAIRSTPDLYEAPVDVHVIDRRNWGRRATKGRSPATLRSELQRTVIQACRSQRKTWSTDRDKTSPLVPALWPNSAESGSQPHHALQSPAEPLCAPRIGEKESLKASRRGLARRPPEAVSVLGKCIAWSGHFTLPIIKCRGHSKPPATATVGRSHYG
jgi:hypothetical protein